MVTRERGERKRGGRNVIPNGVRDQGGWGIRKRGSLVGEGCEFDEVKANELTSRADRVPAPYEFHPP